MTATATSPSATTESRAASARPVALAWLYVIGGAIGLGAAFALVLEKLSKLSNPGYIPSCSMNPVVSCGSVMDSPQAALFGFPNPLTGIAAFPVLITAGVALLARFDAPRWFWAGLQVATTLAVVFIHWLIFASLYQIGALCPYCMIVWAVTIPIFWYTTLHNLQRARSGGDDGSADGGGTLVIARFHSVVLVLWYIAIVGLILQAFWSYWSSLF